MRLEQMEKKEAAKRRTDGEPLSSPSKNNGVLPTIPSAMSEGGRTSTHRGSVQSVDPPFAMSDARYPPEPPVGSSLTEIGSHPELSHESSDDLVHRHRSNNEKPIPPLPIHRSPIRSRVRRYETFENTLTTFFFKGHAMTGGSDWYSAGLALVLLFGMSGVWLGTTGVWMWQHGSEYGLAKGAGIAVTIIFA
jgi:palmitoyltransferase ZDHHC9/14/18